VTKLFFVIPQKRIELFAQIVILNFGKKIFIFLIQKFFFLKF